MASRETSLLSRLCFIPSFRLPEENGINHTQTIMGMRDHGVLNEAIKTHPLRLFLRIARTVSICPLLYWSGRRRFPLRQTSADELSDQNEGQSSPDNGTLCFVISPPFEWLIDEPFDDRCFELNHLKCTR